MNRGFILTATCAAATACSSGGTGGLETVVTDSAGVTIVTIESMDGLPSRAITGPVLDLAISEDSSEASVRRVSAVRRLPDGSIIVADGGSRRLKLFGPDGIYLRTLGGSQEDSVVVEFSGITAIWPVARNRIAAFDQRLRRVTTLGLEGGPARVSSFSMRPGNIASVGRLESGDVLFRNLLIDVPDSGFVSTDVAITRFAEDGSFVDTVGVWPSARMGRLGRPPLQLVSSPMFEPRLIGAAAGDRLLVSDCRTPRYLVVDPENGLDRIVVWSTQLDPVTEDDIQAFRDRRLQELDAGQQRQAELFLDGMPINETLPACDQLRIDPDGRAWVRTFLRPSASSQTWLVFDPDGRPVFSLELSAGTRIMDVGSEHITVIERRPLDVDRILVYGIE